MLHEISLSPSSVARLLNWLSNCLKRAFDIFVSLIALTLLSPFLGLIVFAIRKDSPGPVLYRGRRIGRGGKEFKILKFRTMYEAAASYAGPKVTAHDDDRITPLGHWLRDTKLNELPQIINVLKGDMSLVGPRPEDPDIAKDWPPDVWNEVLSVRPGITSPASVQYRNEEVMLSSKNVLQKYMQELGPDKMRLDQLYVRYRSFWLDLDTLFWTALVLLPKIGSYQPPEDLLFVGPITRLMRRYVSWFTIDTIVTFGAIATTALLWRLTGPFNEGWLRSIMAGLAFAFLFSMTGTALGVNRISWAKASLRDLYDLLPPWILSSMIAFLANRIVKFFPSAMVLTASGLVLLGFIITRYRGRLVTTFLNWAGMRTARVARERVLIVGSGPAAQHAAWLLDHPMNAGKFKVVGFVDNDLLKQGMRIYGATVVGTTKEISHLAEKYDIGVIILAENQLPLKEYRPKIEMCKATRARVVVLPDFLGSLSGLTAAIPMMGAPASAPLMIPQTGSLGGSNGSKAAPSDACLHCLMRYSSAQFKGQPEADRPVTGGDLRHKGLQPGINVNNSAEK